MQFVWTGEKTNATDDGWQVMAVDHIYYEIAPWGAGRFRKLGVPPMDCIYEKDLKAGTVTTPNHWTDEEKTTVMKRFALQQARERAGL